MYDRRILVAIKYAWSFIGTFYSWGGDSPMAGFDCSGFICEILKSIGLLLRRQRFSAAGLWDHFRDNVVSEPESGCLVMYHSLNDSKKIVHVEFCLDDKYSIGASGGGKATVTKDDAMRHNAFIKVRPIKSRAGIHGYVNPFMEVSNHD